MLNLAYWAKCNPWPARIIITVCSFIIGYAGIELGLLLFARDINLTNSFLLFSLMLFFAAALFYPVKAHYSGQSLLFFKLTRVFGAIILVSGLLMALFLGNKLPTSQAFASSSKPVAQFTVLKKTDNSSVTKVKGLGNKLKLKIAKRIAKKVEKWQAKGKNSDSKDLNILYGVLLLLGGLAAMVLVSALSCSLICNGAEAIGLIVMLLGLVGVLAIFSLSFRKFFPKMSKGNTWLAGTGFLLFIFLLLALAN